MIASGIGAGFSVPCITSSAGEIRIDPAVQLVSSAPSPISGGANVLVMPIPSVSASGVAAGQTFTAIVHADVGSDTLLFASLPVTPVLLPFGTLWISPIAAEAATDG